MLQPEEFSQISALLGSIEVPAHLNQDFHALMLMKGALAILRQDATPVAIDQLATAALFAPIDEIQADAFSSIQGLALENNPAAQTVLYRLAVYQSYEPAISFLQITSFAIENQPLKAAFLFQYNRQDGYAQFDANYELLTDFYVDPENASLRSKILQAAQSRHMENLGWILEALVQADLEIFDLLVERFPSLSLAEKHLMAHRFSLPALAGQKQFQKVFCDISIRFADDLFAQFAREHGFEPEEPLQRALYLFLSGQWEKYEGFDFSHKYLVAAYNAADEDTRQKILAQARYSGQIGWLDQLANSHTTRWLKDLSDEDWLVSIHSLEEAGRFEDLWKLSQAAPPFWSVNILNRLQAADRLPASGQPGSQEFDQLVALAKACSQANVDILPVRTLASPGNGINTLTIQAASARMLCGGADASLYLWNLKDRSWLPKQIRGAAQQTRALEISPDGDYLVCASGDNVIRIYRREDFTLIKSLEGHQGLIRKLLFHPDGRTLFSVSFDGSLRAWRFPLGPEIKKLQSGSGEIFALVHFSPRICWPAPVLIAPSICGSGPKASNCVRSAVWTAR